MIFDTHMHARARTHMHTHNNSLAENSAVDTECLEVLLSFALAGGNVNQIINTIMMLLGTYG